jgi:hypothetical protein
LGPKFTYCGEPSTAVRADSQSLIAACRSFKCPHLGCLKIPGSSKLWILLGKVALRYIETEKKKKI